MLLNVAFSELKMKKGKVVLTNRGSIQNAVRNTFGEFDSKLKDFAQSMTEAVVNLTDAVEELNTKNTK